MTIASNSLIMLFPLSVVVGICQAEIRGRAPRLETHIVTVFAGAARAVLAGATNCVGIAE